MLNRNIIKSIKTSKGNLEIVIDENELWIELHEYIESKVHEDYNKDNILFEKENLEDDDELNKIAKELQKEIKTKTGKQVEIEELSY